jgi:glucosamine-6-phosphate deaminase
MNTDALIGNIAVNIYETRALMGIAAATAVASTVRHLLAQKAEVNIVFAAAPSQNEFLAALVREDIDWERINAFHMDEYIGLENGSEATFSRYLKTHLFNHVRCKAVHFIQGDADNAQVECNRYAGLLQQYPIDIVCMGIGENNHIAFNDPHVADFNDTEVVKTVALDTECRQQQVNDGCFPSLAAVPTHAITLTVHALLHCKYIFCTVPGERKANAVYHTLHSPVGEQYPSTALRTHRAVQMFLDKDSAGEIVKGAIPARTRHWGGVNRESAIVKR